MENVRRNLLQSSAYFIINVKFLVAFRFNFVDERNEGSRT